MTETGNIHGHELLRMVHEAAEPFTRQSLRAESLRRWGEHARFCTCSAADMTFDQLMVFLLGRGKLLERGGRIYSDISQMCSGESGHDHHH